MALQHSFSTSNPFGYLSKGLHDDFSQNPIMAQAFRMVVDTP